MKKMCNSNRDQECNEDCVAYNPDGFIIIREPYFDRSMPIPGWVWKPGKACRAAVCKAGGFAIEYFEELEPDMEGNWRLKDAEDANISTTGP